MERMGEAWAVGVGAVPQPDRVVRTFPVPVRVRAFVDDGEARRVELVTQIHGDPVEPRVLGFAPSTTPDLLTAIREAARGAGYWPPGRVQFVVEVHTTPGWSCWVGPSVALAMLAALQQATEGGAKIDRRIWHGRIGGRGPQAARFAEHAVAQAEARGVEVVLSAPHGGAWARGYIPADDNFGLVLEPHPEVVPKEGRKPPSVALPRRFAARLLVAALIRVPVTVQAGVGRQAAAFANRALPRLSDEAMTRRALARSTSLLDPLWPMPTGAQVWCSDPVPEMRSPLTGLREHPSTEHERLLFGYAGKTPGGTQEVPREGEIALAGGGVLHLPCDRVDEQARGILVDTFGFDSGTRAADLPFLVLELPDTGRWANGDHVTDLSAAYDTDDPWVVVDEAALARVLDLRGASAPVLFDAVLQLLHVVQE